MKSKQVSNFSRRNVLKAGAAVLATPYLISRPARADQGTVKIMGVSTVALQDWSAFEAETGLKMDFVGVNSDPGLYVQEVVANEAGDSYDIFIFDGGIEDRLGASGHFQKIDPAAMKLWGAVADSVKSSALLQGADGTQYGVPIVFNADSFGYHVDAISEAEPFSWGMVFENEKMLGKIALEDTWLTTLPNAALYLISKGKAITDPSNMTPEEAKMTADFLIERKKAGQFRALWHSYEESVDLLGNREVLIAECWEPVIKQLQRDGKNVRYASMKEGYSKWMIGAYLPSQAKDERLARAYKALDWFLDGHYGAQMAIQQGYATANPQAALAFAKAKGLSETDLAAIKLNIEKVEQKMTLPHYWQNSAPQHVEAIEAEWQRFKQA